MNIYIKLITFSLVFLFSTLSSALAQSVQQLAKKALAATVSLTVQDRSGNTLRRGSGFFIQEDLIATTLHVIEGDVRVSAILANSETKHRTHVTATDEANNLALLKVRGHGITPLDLSDSDKVRSGETVYVPQASLGTVSVSTIRNRRNIDTKNERLRLTDSYWTGNSGAPLLNLKGKVVGIVVSNYGARNDQRSNLAIPSNPLKALLTRSLRGKGPVQRENEKSVLPDSHSTVAQLMKKALAATVSLKIQDRNGNTLRRGCGFFIQEDLIATTFRVIEGDVQVSAILANSETTYRTDVTAIDQVNNLALLKVTGRGVTPLLLADSDTVWPSETVYIPKALLGTVSVNTIRDRRNIDTKKERLRMTISIWAGNSGAPLLNLKGKVVGMFVSNYGAEDNQTSNLAIPSNALKALLTRPPRVEPVPDRHEKPDLPDRPPTVPDLAKIALAATVSLEVRNKSGVLLGSGSGFFVQRDLIATNYHVIEGAAKVSATIVNSKTMYRIEGVTATDEAYDLALLKVVGYGVTPLPLGDSDTVQIGETVYVAGNPQGLPTFSDGIISGRRDQYTKKERLQMTAPISRGSSGGPVLNRKGRVIGVSQSMYHPLDGILLNFAVPSNALETLLGQSGKAKPLSHGNTAVSYIGCMIRGYEKRMSGDYAGAIREFTDAIDLDSNAATTYVLRGICRAELGLHFAAISDYDIAIRLDPADANAYFMRGVTKGVLGNNFAAIADYDMPFVLTQQIPMLISCVGLLRGR
ncbi:MAG: trypsin-like peptidase domain-containing protein [Candidatus Poribacteria bacterium]|nr:trypsin-like peptidase domain-containing protein [Candidatus Poribacteria bacterium]